VVEEEEEEEESLAITIVSNKCPCLPLVSIDMAPLEQKNPVLFHRVLICYPVQSFINVIIIDFCCCSF